MAISERIHFFRLMRGMTQKSVSYTHLDVYKRQVLHGRRISCKW